MKGPKLWLINLKGRSLSWQEKMSKMIDSIQAKDTTSRFKTQQIPKFTTVTFLSVSKAPLSTRLRDSQFQLCQQKCLSRNHRQRSFTSNQLLSKIRWALCALLWKIMQQKTRLLKPKIKLAQNKGSTVRIITLLSSLLLISLERRSEMETLKISKKFNFRRHYKPYQNASWCSRALKRTRIL